MERLLSPFASSAFGVIHLPLCEAIAGKRTESGEGGECGSWLKLMILCDRHFIPREALFFANIEIHEAGVYLTNRTLADEAGCCRRLFLAARCTLSIYSTSFIMTGIRADFLLGIRRLAGEPEHFGLDFQPNTSFARRVPGLFHQSHFCCRRQSAQGLRRALVFWHLACAVL
jgi:hypothetical protein